MHENMNFLLNEYTTDDAAGNISSANSAMREVTEHIRNLHAQKEDHANELHTASDPAHREALKAKINHVHIQLLGKYAQRVGLEHSIRQNQKKLQDAEEFKKNHPGFH